MNNDRENDSFLYLRGEHIDFAYYSIYLLGFASAVFPWFEDDEQAAEIACRTSAHHRHAGDGNDIAHTVDFEYAVRQVADGAVRAALGGSCTDVMK